MAQMHTSRAVSAERSKAISIKCTYYAFFQYINIVCVNKDKACML